jgi:hypothetical protein
MSTTLEAKVAAEGWWAGEHKIKLDGKSDNGVWSTEVDGATNKRCRVRDICSVTTPERISPQKIHLKGTVIAKAKQSAGQAHALNYPHVAAIWLQVRKIDGTLRAESEVYQPVLIAKEDAAPAKPGLLWGGPQGWTKDNLDSLTITQFVQEREAAGLPKRPVNAVSRPLLTKQMLKHKPTGAVNFGAAGFLSPGKDKLVWRGDFDQTWDLDPAKTPNLLQREVLKAVVGGDRLELVLKLEDDVDNECVVTAGRLSFYGNLSKKRAASPAPIRPEADAQRRKTDADKTLRLYDAVGDRDGRFNIEEFGHMISDLVALHYYQYDPLKPVPFGGQTIQGIRRVADPLVTMFGQAANTGTLTLDRTQFLALVRQWSSHSQAIMQTLTSRAKQPGATADLRELAEKMRRYGPLISPGDNGIYKRLENCVVVRSSRGEK